jgi:hypothetical protein
MINSLVGKHVGQQYKRSQLYPNTQAKNTVYYSHDFQAPARLRDLESTATTSIPEQLKNAALVSNVLVTYNQQVEVKRNG